MFEIAFTPVSEAYRLGDKVVLKGNVKAFNGMMVQEVPLAYTRQICPYLETVLFR